MKDNKELLAANAVDPHYQLIESGDSAFPGPKAYTLVAGFPVGPWIAEGPESRWIAPRAQQGVGNAPGNYTYRLTFDLTGYDPNRATITGQWAVDNGGVDIILNEIGLGIPNGGGFGAFSEFTITAGFVEGTNTLDFVVSNAGEVSNPTGLRVELRGTVELPDEPPTILTQPKSQTVVAGEDVTLMVVADGTPPLAYQWRWNGANVADATEAKLTLAAVTANQAGDYSVVIANATGSIASATAVVTVLEPIPGLFNTGVGDDGAGLEDYAPDPHYRLATNPDGDSSDTYIQDSTVFPIVAGPWVANNDRSKWIGPRGETSAAARGDYVYRLLLDLTGLDLTTVFLTGKWSTDNVGLAILLNGVDTGLRNTAQFGGFTDFAITSGFLPGTNTLDFKLNNSDAVSGYTGLRVEGVRGGGRKGTVVHPPSIVTPPQSRLAVPGDQVTFTVQGGGTPPLGHQWQFNGAVLANETNRTLMLANLSASQAGDYTVTVSNPAGTVTSAAAKLTILDKVPGLFDTGVGADRKPLADAAVDPHYRLVANADGDSPNALVEDSTLFPIVAGPWVANSAVSKWIGPRGDTAEAAAGDYAYEITFDLAGFDPATTFLAGGWATDNQGSDILLNGVSTGLSNGNEFAALTDFLITSGFVPGTNTVRFVVSNGAPGWTGLRVERLRAGGRQVAVERAVLAIARGDRQITLAWPASSAGFNLFATADLANPNWRLVAEPTVLVGNANTVTLPLADGARFFRLQQ